MRRENTGNMVFEALEYYSSDDGLVDLMAMLEKIIANDKRKWAKVYRIAFVVADIARKHLGVEGGGHGGGA